MRLVLQRVSWAKVDIAGKTHAEIGPGFMILAGFGADDPDGLPQSKVWRTMLGKILDLRVFPDNDGKLNLSLCDTHGEILCVSQFTLYADCRKGRRPSFHLAGAPQKAQTLYEAFVADLTAAWPDKVRSGVFAAEMDVSLCNSGPVTILLDSGDFQ